MSQVRPDIDLGALARPPEEARPPRRSKLRILVPLAILLAFAIVLVSTLGDLWKGAVEVSVVRPRVVDASSTASAGFTYRGERTMKRHDIFRQRRSGRRPALLPSYFRWLVAILGVASTMLFVTSGALADEPVSLSGVVRDGGGQPLASVRVTLSLLGPSNLSTSVLSAADGSYSLTVAPGNYSLRLESGPPPTQPSRPGLEGK